MADAGRVTVSVVARAVGGTVLEGTVLGGTALDGTGVGGDVVVSGVTHDSGRVEPGWLFCAVPGARHDGADFAQHAVRAGAAAVLTQRRLDVAVPQILVEDVRASMANAARVVHGDPAGSLRLVGVTGTNGKTTVVSLLSAVLTASGANVASIGTLSGTRTTPEAPDLQERLAEYVAAGVTHVVMEVSSHALEMHRVDGLVFEVAVFTNLGRDHLDFHGNQEAYFAAKARLFEVDRCERAVVNTDDVHGRLLADTLEVPVQRFGVSQLGDLRRGSSDAMRTTTSSFTWRGEAVTLPLAGRHNVSNALAAAEAAFALGVPTATVAEALARVERVPGRFEVLDSPPGAPTVVVDYAHTPDALENVLEAASELRSGDGQVVVVFGCGGDRDPGKRPLMGAAATRGADVVVVTSDNPRGEDPQGIITEVLAGCDDSVVVEADRREAIARALRDRGSHDVVLIAGKGHEVGQEFADRTEEFDDRVIAAELLHSDGGHA